MTYRIRASCRLQILGVVALSTLAAGIALAAEDTKPAAVPAEIKETLFGAFAAAMHVPQMEEAFARGGMLAPRQASSQASTVMHPRALARSHRALIGKPSSFSAARTLQIRSTPLTCGMALMPPIRTNSRGGSRIRQRRGT